MSTSALATPRVEDTTVATRPTWLLTRPLALVACGALLQTGATADAVLLGDTGGLAALGAPLLFGLAVACYLVALPGVRPGRMESAGADPAAEPAPGGVRATAPGHAGPGIAGHWSLPVHVGTLVRSGLLAVLLLGGLCSAALYLPSLARLATPAVYDSDAAAFNAYNAALVAQGVNPYTADSRFWDAVRAYPRVGATPLRAGRYANATWPPTYDAITRDLAHQAAHPERRGGEYAPASLHSYPALSFLVYLPAVWLGLPGTGPITALALVAFVLACVWGAPRRFWLPVALILAASGFLISYALRGSFEVVALLPVVLAWRLRDRRVLSAALLGLACAVKQIAWPLAPLYLVIVWREHGPGEALRRAGIALVAFLVPNAPFLLAAPDAWGRSMLLPVSLPVFPSGIGLIALARGGLLPLWPSPVYAALELLAFAAALAWVAFRLWRRSELALVAGLLPFALAWHSTAGYFVALPALTLYALLVPARLGQGFAAIGRRDAA